MKKIISNIKKIRERTENIKELISELEEISDELRTEVDEGSAVFFSKLSSNIDEYKKPEKAVKIVDWSIIIDLGLLCTLKTKEGLTAVGVLDDYSLSLVLDGSIFRSNPHDIPFDSCIPLPHQSYKLSKDVLPSSQIAMQQKLLSEAGFENSVTACPSGDYSIIEITGPMEGFSYE